MKLMTGKALLSRVVGALFAGFCVACSLGSVNRSSAPAGPYSGSDDLAAQAKALHKPCLSPTMVNAFNQAQVEEGAARTRAYMRRCQAFDGDVGLWQVLPPGRGDAWDLNERYSACIWEVTRQSGQIRGLATALRGSGDIQLPFEPSSRPRENRAVCDEEGAQQRGRFFPVRAFVSLDDGYLVGYNAGEWGGGLYWYDRLGQLRQVVNRENIVWMFSLPLGVIVFSGVDHLGSREGRVSVLKYSEDRWSDESVELPGAPMALLFESEESALVVVYEALLRIRWGSDVSARVLHEAVGDWSFVTSLEKEQDGTIFLGMRHSVARLAPRSSGYSEEWLVPEGASLSRSQAIDVGRGVDRSRP